MKMKKLWRSRKALSPVIAAIILIAVTVAVSIAVAAWMGALTFVFMGTEQLDLGSPHNWETETVLINATNSGGSTLIISSVYVQNTLATFTVDWSSGAEAVDATLVAGERVALNVTYATGFEPSILYTFKVVTQNNKEFMTTGTPPQ